MTKIVCWLYRWYFYIRYCLLVNKMFCWLLIWSMYKLWKWMRWFMTDWNGKIVIESLQFIGLVKWNQIGMVYYYCGMSVDACSGWLKYFVDGQKGLFDHRNILMMFEIFCWSLKGSVWWLKYFVDGWKGLIDYWNT